MFVKTFIALLLSGAVALASDVSVITANTLRTNAETGTVYSVKRDIFTEGGQTNLVRESVTVAGALESRTHFFYHNGSLVGLHWINYKNHYANFSSSPAPPYNFTVGLNGEKIKDVVIISNSLEVETFVYTNGIFLPDSN